MICTLEMHKHNRQLIKYKQEGEELWLLVDDGLSDIRAIRGATCSMAIGEWRLRESVIRVLVVPGIVNV